MFEFMIIEIEKEKKKKFIVLLVFYEILNCCLVEYLKVFR